MSLTKRDLLDICENLPQPNLYWRPLVCSGSLSNMRAFIVGERAATPIYSSDMPVEEYIEMISDHDVFTSWIETRGSKSPTREGIEAVLNWFPKSRNYGIAETNVFPCPAHRGAAVDVHTDTVGRKIFSNRIFSACDLQLVLAHGSKSLDNVLPMIRKKYRVTWISPMLDHTSFFAKSKECLLVRYETYDGREGRLFACEHLWKYKTMRPRFELIEQMMKEFVSQIE